MKHLTILVPEGGANISSITGAYKILMRANEYQKQQGRDGCFEIVLAGMSSSVEFHGGLFAVRPHVHIDDIVHTDLVIVPSLNHNYELATASGNERLVRWVKEQYANGAAIAGICTGAFILAAAGLLEGKSCSTHWAAADTFRKKHPGVKLETDRLITDEHGIYTNGGAYSFLNLIIYLIEKYYDRATAIYCAKVFQIDMDRESQSAFIIFTGQKQHEDEQVREAQLFIEQHWQERISVAQLAARYALSRRNFDRRFIKATGNTPLVYQQRVRIEYAKKAFENTRRNVSEVMYDAGYSDMKAFREVFRKITGMAPLAYRNRYNRDAVTK